MGAEKYAQELFQQLRTGDFPNLPEKLTFLHAEDVLEMYPDLPRKQRETMVLQRYPAIFISGIGWPLKDGYPHEMRAADYDDWATETLRGRQAHARLERRHPRVELRHAATPRAQLNGHPD